MTESERQLIEKLRRIEALFAGTSHAGERVAAAAAMDRIRERLRGLQASDAAIEYAFHLRDDWSKQLFMALLRRYDIRPYRYRGQRHTTVMARMPKSFVDTTLWPEYQEIHDTLRRFLNDVTTRVIAECIHKDTSDAETAERAGPALLTNETGHTTNRAI